MDVFSMAARLIVAASLLLAAWAKFRDLAGFERGLHDYGLLPPAAERFVVRLLPAAEVVIGVALLLGLAMPWSPIAAAVVLAIFGAAIAIAAHRGRDIPCHCFGASSRHRVGVGALLRSVVLLILAIVATINPAAGAVSLETLTSWPSGNLVSLVGIAVAMTLAVMLAEPLVMLASGVRAAWRRTPELRAVESARRGRTCGPATPIENGLAS